MAKRIDIDGKKLETELIKRGLNIKDVSLEMGLDISTLGRYIRHNYVSTTAKAYLESKYNIDIKAIEHNEDITPQMPSDMPTYHSMDYDLLKATIKSAVKPVWEQLKYMNEKLDRVNNHLHRLCEDNQKDGEDRGA